MAAKKVRHLKTKNAEVSIQFPGKKVIITITLRSKLAEQLTFRLMAPQRHQNKVSKRRKL